MNLDESASAYYRIDQEIKKLTEEKNRIRSAIQKVAIEDWDGRDYDKPVTHVHFPAGVFITSTEVTEHLKRNFPAWEIMDLFEEQGGFTSFLKKKSECMKYTHSGTSHSVTIIPASSSPIVNWNTLELEWPEMAKEIRDEEWTYKLNTKKLDKFLGEHPESFSVLNRHIQEGLPSSRLTVKPIGEKDWIPEDQE